LLASLGREQQTRTRRSIEPTTTKHHHRHQYLSQLLLELEGLLCCSFFCSGAKETVEVLAGARVTLKRTCSRALQAFDFFVFFLTKKVAWFLFIFSSVSIFKKSTAAADIRSLFLSLSLSAPSIRN
jgi:hypothetical protein